MSESSDSIRAMAEQFSQRDDAAVSEFNSRAEFYGQTIEARLAFVEGRLMDMAGLLYWALNEIANRESDA